MANKRAKSNKPSVAIAATPLRHQAFAELAELQKLREQLPATHEVPSPPVPPDTAPSLSLHGLAMPTAKVVLRREKKARRGKTVTRVEGLADTITDKQRWAKWLKRQLGCGAIVEGEDVLLLGDVLDRAASLLESEGVRRVVRST